MKNRKSGTTLCLVLLSALIVLFSSREQSAQEPGIGLAPYATRRQLNSEFDRFVIYRYRNGAACRRMTEPEARLYHSSERSAPLAIISDEPVTQLSATSQDQSGWKIVLHGTQQLESYPEAKAVFIRVASRFESFLKANLYTPPSSPITAVEVDFGPSWFGVPYQTSSQIGVTAIAPDGIVAVAPFDIIFSGVSDSLQQIAVHNALPFPIKTDFGETVSLSWTYPVFQSLFPGSPISPQQDSAIGFNSTIKFDFDPNDGIDADKLDFEAAVTREMARVMGFISNVGDRELNPAPQPGPLGPITADPAVLDLYRFRPGVTMENFTDVTRVLRSGGEQIFFTGDAELPLSTGRPDGTGGDGRPAGHWKDDELTGQYIGIMDPTLSPGLRAGITANDLIALGYFGIGIRSGTDVMEVLSHDDNSREETLPPAGALVVNRFTPSRYPFTVQSVRAQLPQPADGSTPVGQSLRIVVFADSARTGQPPANPQLLVDRTITIPALPDHRFLEVMLPNGPTVNSGDLYVGVQSSSPSVLFAGDTNGAARNRSFISTNNGASFQPLRTGANAPINLMLRAVVTNKFDASNNATPELVTLSPTAVAPGASTLKLFAQGQNFKPETIDGGGFRYKSVVRWNGQDRPTTFLSPSLLRADITAADLANAGKARVTVFTSGPDGGRESAPIEFNVAAENPSPVLTRLDPPVVAVGGGNVIIEVLGRNFTSSSVARLNGANRTTNFISSVKLEVTIPASDLTSAANAEISVTTPAPGGGVSNPLTLRAAPCSFKLSKTSQTTGAARLFDGDGELNLQGVLLETGDHCRWTAKSNADWIALADTNGVGGAPVGYNILNNSSSSPRAGTVTIADQTLTINQLGSPTAVSSASFGQGSAPESIATIFGVGLAKATQVATTLPLPTTLAGATVTVARLGGGRPQPAPLFFVSPNQINFLVPQANDGAPLSPTGGIAFLSVFVDGQLVSDGYISLAPVAPGLFSANASGAGVAAAVALRVKADGSQQFEPVAEFDQAQKRFVARPIDPGPEGERVFLILFGTGIRGYSSPLSLQVKVGGIDAQALFAGAQGDFAGLDQVNIELPRALKGRGEVSITLTADRSGSNQVTVTIK